MGMGHERKKFHPLSKSQVALKERLLPYSLNHLLKRTLRITSSRLSRKHMKLPQRGVSKSNCLEI